MTLKMWFFAVCGILIFAVLQCSVSLDVCLVGAGLPTISRHHMLLGVAHPYSFPPAVVALVLLPVGMFMGHYWSPQNVAFWQTAQMWAPSVALAPLVLLAGVVLGRLLVAQTL